MTPPPPLGGEAAPVEAFPSAPSAAPASGPASPGDHPPAVHDPVRGDAHGGRFRRHGRGAIPAEVPRPTWSFSPGGETVAAEPPPGAPEQLAPLVVHPSPAGVPPPPPISPPEASPPPPTPAVDAMPAIDPFSADSWPVPAAPGRVPPPPSARGGQAIPPPPPPRASAPPGPHGSRSDAGPLATPGGGDPVQDAQAASAGAARGAVHLPLPAGHRRLRRSRPGPMPPRPSERFEVPEDAAGRIQYLEHPSEPAGRYASPTAGVGPPPAAARPPAGAMVPAADEIAGWLSVAALVAVLVVVFVIGIRLTT